MTFRQLFKYSQRIKAESSRNAKIQIISEYLKKLKINEAVYGVYYIEGQIPQGRMNLVWNRLSQLFDLPHTRKRTISLHDLNRTMERIKTERGNKKYEILKPVFKKLDKKSRMYLVSLIFGEAQQGAGQGIVKQAIARVFKLKDKEIEQAYLYNPDLGQLFAYLLEKGKHAARTIGIQLFRPVKPMLAQVTDSFDDALRTLDTAAVEYKLDGVRVQIHRKGDEVRIFSRNLKDRTMYFPELVDIAKRLPAKCIILDGEAVAFDRNGRLVPFQILAKRTTRKKNMKKAVRDIPVSPQFFDILYLGGEDLTPLPYRERYTLLTENVPDRTYRTMHSTPRSAQAARDFFKEALAHGNEGVVIKGIHSAYHPGKRGKHWFKIKRTYTIDCVILAAEWGYGRRKGRLSNIHLGVLDETRTKYLMVGKTFKGLTDNMLQWMTDHLPQYCVHKDKWTVYVRPEVVVEIVFNEVQKSPRYNSGMSLRFARVTRFRHDKNADEIDSIISLEDIQGTP